MLMAASFKCFCLFRCPNKGVGVWSTDYLDCTFNVQKHVLNKVYLSEIPSSAPELKNLLGTKITLLRLTQVLGLQAPADGETLENTCMLEFYVSPKYLFRPSADPDVTHESIALAFDPNESQKLSNTFIFCSKPCTLELCDCGQSGGIMVPYKDWFNIRRSTVFSQNPYPWTGLGYTYDWGNPNPPHFGISEFVINAGELNKVKEGKYGIPVVIRSADWTGEYFKKKNNRQEQAPQKAERQN